MHGETEKEHEILIVMTRATIIALTTIVFRSLYLFSDIMKIMF